MSSKYAALPDLDISQDIYETPDLADDVSTLPTSTSPPPTTHSDSDSEQAIDHTHLRPTTARGRFKHSEVDASAVDFSDRISGKRRSYRASSRRRRRRQGYEEYGTDDEDDELYYGDETIERRLARLRREVEELKGALDEREVEKHEAGEEKEGSGGDVEGEADEEEDEEDVRAGIQELSEVLEGLQTTNPDERGAHAKLAKKMAISLDGLAAVKEDTTKKNDGVEAPEINGQAAATYTVTYAPSFKKTHTLGKVADFDGRLSVLEKVLGMSSSALANIDQQLPRHAMIPTLNDLSRQMAVLTNSTTTSLDAAGRRVRQLVAETDKLTESRRAAKAAGIESGDIESEETVAKINALYGALPAIESMGPLLPAVLDRLRSLRAIHADAGKASENLERVEKRQEEMAGEIQRWEEALNKVEGVMKESQGTIEQNMGKVEGWVKEIEEKMKKTENL